MSLLPNPNTTHSVPGFPVICGHPAKAVRKRFDDELSCPFILASTVNIKFKGTIMIQYVS